TAGTLVVAGPLGAGCRRVRVAGSILSGAGQGVYDRTSTFDQPPSRVSDATSPLSPSWREPSPFVSRFPRSRARAIGIDPSNSRAARR
ncbi:MAG: hypothetical protein O3C39_06400, partial [Planctomycetota bacterium]|nr:hypothetical protein [Planctomycetota bacterium]